MPGVVEFETERVRVCRLVPAHLASLGALFRDPEATGFDGEGLPLPPPRPAKRVRDDGGACPVGG